MCTVSIIPWRDGGFRLVSNRDELRTRAAALPPVVRSVGGMRAILPVDPAGGGTWVAVNEAGVAMTLLNVNDPLHSPAVRPLPSRGLLIPRLLSASSANDVLNRLQETKTPDHEPFRLVIADGTVIVEAVWNGTTFRSYRHAHDKPAMFTSSGLGDHLVAAPRRKLFLEMTSLELVSGLGDLPAAQDAFHDHRWSDRPHLSVNMSRANARTVSRTVVEVSPETVELHYAPLPIDNWHDAIDVHVHFRRLSRPSVPAA